jgi:hypothetical protein
VDILLTSLFSAALLAIENLIPWRQLLKRELPKTPAYLMGVAGLYLPLSILLYLWGDLDALWAMWAVGLSGGTAVIVLKAGRAWLDAERKARNEAEAVEVLRRGKAK